MKEWSNQLRKNDYGKLADSFESNKTEDYNRLKNLGVPVIDTIVVSLKEFNQNNSKLMEFFSKYNDFVLCIIPKIKDSEKTYKIGDLYSFEDCKNFIYKHITENEELYDISVTEHKLNLGSGIIISNDKKLVIEVADGYLDDLSYGRVVPVGCIIENGNHNFNTDDESKKDWMMKALNHIKEEEGHKKGYFEFIVVGDNEIRFFDYKINKAYTNI